MSRIIILYWIDFICPYCFIAIQRMKNLMHELNITNQFEFKPLSYEIDPYAARERELNIIENFAKKYKISIEEAKQRVEDISKLGRAEGIDFKYATCRGGNSFKAHRLVKYIQRKGNYKNTEKITSLLYDAYFTKNLLISDERVLIDLGTKVGCTREELEKFIYSDELSKEVKQDEEEANSKGIDGVPYFIVDNEIIPGAASKEMMKNVLLRALKKKEEKNKIHPEDLL